MSGSGIGLMALLLSHSEDGAGKSSRFILAPPQLRSLHLYEGTDPTPNQTIYTEVRLVLEHNRNVETFSFTF